MGIKKIFLITCLLACSLNGVKRKAYEKKFGHPRLEKFLENTARKKRIFHHMIWGNIEYLNTFPEDKDLYFECAKYIFGSYRTIDNKEMIYVFDIPSPEHNEKLIKAIEYGTLILDGYKTIKKLQKARTIW